MRRKKQFEERWQTWGWHSVLLDIASEPVFHLAGFNGIQSAIKSNIYDCLIYLGKNADYNSIS